MCFFETTQNKLLARHLESTIAMTSDSKGKENISTLAFAED